jgi:cytochrome P450
VIAAVRRPPGPPQTLLSRLVYRPGRDPLAFFATLARANRDLAYVRMGGEDVYLVSDPELVREVFVTSQRKFIKGRGLQRAKRLLGEGLLTSEGADHVRQRRLIQPAFHRDRIASYAGVMTAYADRLQSGWTDGAVIDAAQEMTRVTLAIVGKALFDTDVEAHAPEVGAALSAVMDTFWLQMLPFYDVLDKLPIPKLRRSREARARLDHIVYSMIAERRASPTDRGDLLSMLLQAQDEESGRGMSDHQVRDEAMTIFLAGHETTANALSWTWHLLSGSPEVESAFHAELAAVLGGRLPSIDDLPRLTYTEQIIMESMRLYPPAWLIGRRAIEDVALGGYTLPAGSLVIISPWLMHRDARVFADPERFRPERWTPAFRQQLAPFAYVPFGGGARRCIGESFAMMELVLVLATIASRWRLVEVPGHPVVPQPVVTLRLKHGLRVTTVQRRTE